ncbi:GntR family transcriptional regulator [Streptomyces sp. P38-E01]|uniref:GntR family transcriptional regulator n=1 Tax=Streptomyces tardus TaxID=2780544 RepID=A0A949JF94_9ACTN|nr:GntR family transcriptional regulator [Streptomyces tardus]MBU7598377.1 GntR family transcriptional regulator [Streptomyces tardus]
MADSARRIADELRARIGSGELSPGDRLPGEPALVGEYGVAKETARRALTLLVTEGLAVRKRGSGTYVRSFRPLRRVANKRLSQAGWGNGRSIWSADVDDRELRVADVEVAEVPAPERVSRALALSEGDPVVVRSRRYLVDGEAVQTATSWLPAELVRGTAITRPDTGSGGIYARLAELGLAPARFAEELRARMPSRAETELLALPEATPVVEIHRVAFTADDLAVELNEMLLDAGSYVLEYHLDSQSE